MKKFLVVLLLIGVMVGFTGSAGAVTFSDFVFVIDATGSMSNEIAAVRSGLANFVTGLDAAEIDYRFSIILFGGAPELVLDFTSDAAATATALSKISSGGAVAGFQNNHNVNPEAGLEAIRIALGQATDSTLLRTNVGGTGGLDFRSEARKNIILVTDEDSDLPFYTANRVGGQITQDPPTSLPLATAWQTEVDNTAAAIILEQAFINMLINPGDAPSIYQYGDPTKSVSDANFLNFDADATLTALEAAGLGMSLEAQVLRADLIGRAFNITQINTENFIDNFFAAKIEEQTPPSVPEPATMLLLGAGLLGLAAFRRRLNK